jgi:hypothetical protein
VGSARHLLPSAGPEPESGLGSRRRPCTAWTPAPRARGIFKASARAAPPQALGPRSRRRLQRPAPRNPSSPPPGAAASAPPPFSCCRSHRQFRRVVRNLRLPFVLASVLSVVEVKAVDASPTRPLAVRRPGTSLPPRELALVFARASPSSW